MLDNQFISNLKVQPETYKTILKDKFDNRSTITNLVRRKISSLISYHFVCAGILDGTRFGEKIFYASDKDYLIVIVRHHMRFIYYYCKDIVEVDEHELLLKACFELVRDEWIYKGDVLINRSWFLRFF